MTLNLQRLMLLHVKAARDVNTACTDKHKAFLPSLSIHAHHELG